MTRDDATGPGAQETMHWVVSGMDCGSCATKVEQAVGKLPGVSGIRVSAMTETMSAALDESVTPAAKVEALVSALGYQATRRPPERVVTQSWIVSGMDCGGCVGKIRTALEALAGVSDVRASPISETLTVTFDQRSDPGTIEQRVKGLGYALRPVAVLNGQTDDVGRAQDACESHNHDHDHGRPDAKSARKEAAAPHDHAHGANDPIERLWWQTAKGRLVLLTGVLLAVAFASRFVVPTASHWVYIGATLIGVAPVARRALAAARVGIPFTIEMLMTIAASGALVIGAAEEAALVVFLFAVGEVLEGVAANRARASIRALGELVPKSAILEENGVAREVEARSLVIGQTVLVRPGDRVPADGQIVSGASGIDESPVTGESVPKTKEIGDAVFAGSINREAAIRVRVEKGAADNTISRIIRLVEEAQEARAPTERFIDRFSRVYMPAIVGLAVLVTVVPPLVLGGDWGTWVYRGLALLLIGCPCALVISVPASIASALSAGAREGLLMKGGVVIEQAAKVRIVAFDKTGTLTEGRPLLTDVIAFEGTRLQATEIAAAVETGSSHPLAIAILEWTQRQGGKIRPADDVKAVPGKGMAGSLDGHEIFLGAPRFALDRASMFPDGANADIARLESQGKTIAALVVDGQLKALFALRDEPRQDAAEAVAGLRELGIRGIMLTGDNARTGAAIADGLGLDYRAELMPEDKVAALKELSLRDPVMMIGDGINDAPALAVASVGIAMGSGTDVALETADGALLRNRVSDVVQMIRLSRGAMANIRQNITIALGLKAVFLVTSTVGITGLWIAILADTGATVIVTANALRLLGFFRRNRVRTAHPPAAPEARAAT